MTAFTDRLTDSYLDTKRGTGDGPADDVLRQVLGQRDTERADRTFHRLIRRLDVPLDEFPEPLPEFVRDHEMAATLPPATADAVERIFRDHGPLMLLALLHASLPAVYECRGIARLLVGTGKVTHAAASHAIFNRRIAENAQYMIDVLGPGGLRPGGAGITASLRVRLIHAAIRHFALAGGWDRTLGAPVNQEEMAFTLTTFGVTILDAMALLGVTVSEEDAAAYVEAWNAVGLLLGVEPELLPPTVADARALQSRVRSRHIAATDDGVVLARELLDYASGRMARDGRRHDGPALLVRHLMGEETADRLHVSQAEHWWSVLVPRTMRRLHGVPERPEDPDSWGRVADRLSHDLVRGLVSSFNEFKGHPFRVPDSLEDAWTARVASHPSGVRGPGPPR